MIQEPVRESFKVVPSAPAAPIKAPLVDSVEKTTEMSVMGPDILVKGDIEAVVDLHIEGRVVGDVRCATLVLGPASVITGSIYAERVRVSGLVEGAIVTKDLAIEAAARVKGDITYSRIRIANGGVIEGTVTHTPLVEDASDAKVKLRDVQSHDAMKVMGD
jgi:cytoskeletal protein CcmA (bactofilin family)